MNRLRIIPLMIRFESSLLSVGSNFQFVVSAKFTRLAEVGRLETPKLEGKYDTGQLFLHRVFGYRGVTLFPWMAKVYDRDVPNKDENRESEESSNGYNQVGKEVRSHTHTYYQVLIDSRDCPYVRTQTEAVTFLGNQDNSRSLYAIPGLDYVAHEDILPYTSTEKQPITHELFDKFLMYDPEKDPPFSARETLRAWQEKNHPWLELSDVHKETTENIRVTVIPFYMGQRVAQNTSVYWTVEPQGRHTPKTQNIMTSASLCKSKQLQMGKAADLSGESISEMARIVGCSWAAMWRYCIRLENLGDLTVQLRERHWRIFSLSGSLETVRGRGVVGQEPILSKMQPAFQYSSHVSLQSPCGHMWGTFRMDREDGLNFECRIPPFSLESK